eukprot:6355883-Pyramimonas_sp.AAC.1
MALAEPLEEGPHATPESMGNPARRAPTSPRWLSRNSRCSSARESQARPKGGKAAAASKPANTGSRCSA